MATVAATGPCGSLEQPATAEQFDNSIRLMLQQKWGQNEPREFQLQGIRLLCWHRYLGGPPSKLLLARKTGDGKSLVFQGAATILGGITICVVPLLVLGSDQTTKVNTTGEPGRS